MSALGIKRNELWNGSIGNRGVGIGLFTGFKAGMAPVETLGS